jgi:hypothetical protein
MVEISLLNLVCTARWRWRWCSRLSGNAGSVNGTAGGAGSANSIQVVQLQMQVEVVEQVKSSSRNRWIRRNWWWWSNHLELQGVATVTGTAGSVNTGGGGGGGGGVGPSSAVGGNGGSGIVIIRAPGSANLFQQAQVQTQLQHYPHQLVVVKLLHSQFLEINNRLIYIFLNLDNFV